MSRMQALQSGEGVVLKTAPWGILQIVQAVAPVGGEVGYAPGCEWFVPAVTGNPSVGSMFTNIGNSGAVAPFAQGGLASLAKATWIESDPSSGSRIQLGGALTSTGFIRAGGNVFADTFQAGQSPAATGSDIVIDVYTLPANALNAANRGLTITAGGNFAATANNKTVKLIFNATTAVIGSTVTGGTTIATTGVSAGNNVGWILQGQVQKTGAANSNTQVAQEIATVVGTTHGGCGLAAGITATENAAILIAVTGNAATAASDILLFWWEVTAFN